MKAPVHIIKMITSGLFVIVLALLGINYLFRVSDGRDSHGILEECLFRQSAGSALSRSLKSENLRRWEDSCRLSESIAAVLTSKGVGLLTDASLESERIKTARMARTAHELANSIEEDYLAASNPELAGMYARHFIAALKLWDEGLANGQQETVASGTEHYNAFILWMQSKNRSDFKSMR